MEKTVRLPYFQELKFSTQKSESHKVSSVGKQTMQAFHRLQFRPDPRIKILSTISPKKCAKRAKYSSNLVEIGQNAQSKQLEKLTQHQATWSNVDLLHVALCCVRLFINMAQISRHKRGNWQRDKEVLLVQREKGSKIKRNTVIMEKSCQKSEPFSSSSKAGSQTSEEASPGFRSCRIRTLGSSHPFLSWNATQFPKIQSHSSLLRGSATRFPTLQSPVFHHYVEATPNFRLHTR